MSDPLFEMCDSRIHDHLAVYRSLVLIARAARILTRRFKCESISVSALSRKVAELDARRGRGNGFAVFLSRVARAAAARDEGVLRDRKVTQRSTDD
jgi:hypothetical protein